MGLNVRYNWMQIVTVRVSMSPGFHKLGYTGLGHRFLLPFGNPVYEESMTPSVTISMMQLGKLQLWLYSFILKTRGDMLQKLLLLLVLCAAGVLCFTGNTNAHESSPLLKLLSLVPLTVATSPTKDRGGELWFIDYSAVYELAGVSSSRAVWGVDLRELPVPIDLILYPVFITWTRYLGMAAGRMLATVGFEWFINVDRGLEWGQPPTNFILEGTFDMEAITEALERRGYNHAEVDQVVVLHRYTRYGEVITDPFWKGGDTFVILLPEVGVVANTNTFDSAQSLIQTYKGKQPSLLDNLDYRLLAEVVGRAGGSLIEAVFFHPEALRFPEYMAEMPMNIVFDPYELPEFSLMVLGERQEGLERVVMIGLAYPNTEIAEQASRVVAKRFESWTYYFLVPVIHMFYEGKVRWYVVSGDSKVAGVVEIRYLLPSLENYLKGIFERPPSPWKIFSICYEAIIRRCFSPLWWK